MFGLFWDASIHIQERGSTGSTASMDCIGIGQMAFGLVWETGCEAPLGFFRASTDHFGIKSVLHFTALGTSLLHMHL